ncbi:MAG: Uma2 family endonuclease [Sandaracinaceae bacterium]|nr:MAG: Uma2 family endonuclease [Sandaracinaceae bacterium]
MAEPARSRVSYVEYLALEARAEVKHEYLDGVVRAMAGGTIEHGRLSARVIRLVGAALTGRSCEVYSSDVKVYVAASNRSTYPDATVVCGRVETVEIDAEAIVNPVVLVEVLSDSTEGYDRGEKFRHYRRLESLREYVLVSQREPLVEVWRREGDLWRPVEHGPGEDVRLASVDAAFPVDALYDNPLEG